MYSEEDGGVRGRRGLSRGPTWGHVKHTGGFPS